MGCAYGGGWMDACDTYTSGMVCAYGGGWMDAWDVRMGVDGWDAWEWMGSYVPFHMDGRRRRWRYSPHVCV